ncbi:Transgelin [Thoreauomyces humboldtii]|nr:Transgelin [Thoreauomyces humboldtii]
MGRDGGERARDEQRRGGGQGSERRGPDPNGSPKLSDASPLRETLVTVRSLLPLGPNTIPPNPRTGSDSLHLLTSPRKRQHGRHPSIHVHPGLVPPHDTFQTIDLYEDKNPGQIVDTIFSLSRHAAKLGLLPADQVFGPKLADKHEVTFTDEQLRSGNNAIGLQMGFAGGASQSGQSWGGRRQVVEQGVGTGDASSASQQLGFNGGANASGLTFGGRREIGGEYAQPDQE